MRIRRWRWVPILTGLVTTSLVCVGAPAGAEATATAGSSCATKSEFRAVKQGRTKGAVSRIIGTPGWRYSRNGSREVRKYPWCGSAQRSVLVTFRNGRVESRTLVRQPTTTPSSPQPIDQPAGQQPNPWFVDADGNGTGDYAFDLNNDGFYEALMYDLNGDGRFEQFFIDSGSGGQGLLRDENLDGYYEMGIADLDRNGRGERAYYDGNGDGYYELTAYDMIGSDGIADTWFQTSSSSGSRPSDRAANDQMVTNIVTLQQMRQLNPWAMTDPWRPYRDPLNPIY